MFFVVRNATALAKSREMDGEKNTSTINIEYIFPFWVLPLKCRRHRRRHFSYFFLSDVARQSPL
jgi:hypothetical protein